MTIRFDQFAYEMVAREAELSGIPIAQFVREAALIRALARALAKEHEIPADREFVQRWAEVSQEVVRLSKVDPANHPEG